MSIVSKFIAFCCIFLFLCYVLLVFGTITLIVVSTGIFATIGFTLGARQLIRDQKMGRASISSLSPVLSFMIIGIIVGGIIGLLVILILKPM